MSRSSFLLVCLALVAGVAGEQAIHAQQATTPPQFRGGISLVPLDVRVIDRQGNPVTDLKEIEFTILENGTPQGLRHFSTIDLGTPSAPGPLFADPGTPSPTRRVFLLVLGRGRLQYPGRGADAAITFIRDHVLPQDHVAVLAWNRATAFTTDHARTLALLERFQKGHEGVEMALRSHFSGLAALYADSAFPPKIQAQIDTIFNDPGPTLPVAEATLTATGAQETRTLREGLLTQELRSLIPGGNSFQNMVGDDAESIKQRTGRDLTFDEFIELDRQSGQDVSNLYAGVAYMRHFTGEKHLVYLSESGIFLPSVDDDRQLGVQAADARVAISTILTGGAPGQGSERIARMTGGMYTSTYRAPRFIEQIDRATRFQYVLGYTPINADFDGRFRRVEVRVSRPGVRVIHRQGYLARRTPPPLDGRTIVAQSRVAAAALSTRPIRDIAITTSGTWTSGDKHVDLEVIVPGQQLHLAPMAGSTLVRVSIEVVIICGDSRGRLVGQDWRTVTVELPPEGVTRIMTHGLRLTGRVDVQARPRDLKVVVYDPEADQLGVATSRLRDRRP